MNKYQLWYAQGYQEQASIESSVTTKVIWIIYVFSFFFHLFCKKCNPTAIWS